jgi:3-hydroxyisobutyrate dehydrogenase-like beta-hydroxyacid dehydrogenase
MGRPARFPGPDGSSRVGRVDVGVLFPGEMGAAVGADVRGRVLWASEGRSEATRHRAGAFEDVGTLAELVARSDAILSICPPGIAEDVAREVAGLGFGGLYVDANATSPGRMERIARLLPRVVDGSIVAKTAVNVYLSGPQDLVDEAAALFAGERVVPLPLPGGIGAASALKMAFAGWNKIGVLLEAQAYAVARAYGLEDELAREGVESRRIARAAGRAWRWTDEMHEIADTHAALGLDDGIARGAAAALKAWSGHRDESDLPLPDLLDELRRRPA